jgi:hypothetical protein
VVDKVSDFKMGDTVYLKATVLDGSGPTIRVDVIGVTDAEPPDTLYLQPSALHTPEEVARNYG